MGVDWRLRAKACTWHRRDDSRGVRGRGAGWGTGNGGGRSTALLVITSQKLWYEGHVDDLYLTGRDDTSPQGCPFLQDVGLYCRRVAADLRVLQVEFSPIVIISCSQRGEVKMITYC